MMFVLFCFSGMNPQPQLLFLNFEIVKVVV